MAGATPRIVMLGAGSVGCFVGAAWQAAGCSVGFLGRSAIASEIRRHGVTLTDYDGWRARLAPGEIDFGTDPAALAGADIIALTVKSTATDTAAKQIAKHTRADAIVLSLQNGVGNGETLTRLLPGRTIVQAMVPFNVAHLGEGRWHKGTSGDIVADHVPAMAAFVEKVSEGPAKLRLSANMTEVLWGKLLFNLNNAINALSGESLLDELRQRAYRRIFASAVAETLEVLKAAGIRPAKNGPLPPTLLPAILRSPDWLFRTLAFKVQKVDPKARSSMADDFGAGKPSEIDHINGAVVTLAARFGMATPINSAIVAIVREAEVGGKRRWSAIELERACAPGSRPGPI